MLCSACTTIIIHIRVGDSAPPFGTVGNLDQNKVGHHRTIKDLHRSAIENCHICTQLFQTWEQIYWETFDPHSTLSAQERQRAMVDEVMEMQQTFSSGNYKSSLPSWEVIGPEHVSNYQIGTRPGASERELIFSTNPDYFNTSRNRSGKFPQQWYQWFILKPSQQLQKYTQLEAHPPEHRVGTLWRQNLAQSWLQGCMKGHPQCVSKHSGWRPTRLLQVSRSQPHTVKLVLTKDEPNTEPHRPYLTLSHCWGKDPFLTLTAQTKCLLSQGASLSVLPKTFQDALNMTIFLGFEYIWIDSLCIMQDSIIDWEHESALMGHVYSNGVCNLAATGSPDAEGGLWMSRPPSLNLPCELESNLCPASDPRWHIHSRHLRHATLLLNGPLLKRGWVIQERILAPRTLHFGTNQLFWECRHYQACETYPGGLPGGMYGLKSDLVGFDTLRKTIGTEPPEDHEVMFKFINAFWGKAVTGFSYCNLTKPEDKLVAISGLARIIHERHPQFDFLAGMLRQSLCGELLWSVMTYNGSKDSRRPTAFRAPSWSWASVDTGVQMKCFSGAHGMMSKVLGIEVREGDDPMGQNVSASLRIEAYLMTFTVQYGSNAMGTWGAEFCINGVWKNHSYPLFDMLHKLRDVDEPYRNLHCLVMKDEGKEPVLKEDRAIGPWTICCLLIQPTGLKKGEFKRYGIYELSGLYHKLHTRKHLENVRNEEWLEYESVGEDGKYIVSIV